MIKENMTSKLAVEKRWNSIGALLGIFLVVVGIFFMIFIYGELGHSMSSSPNFNNTKYGADFYTDIYDKVFEILNTTYVTADGTLQVSDNLGILGGSAFVACGLIVFVHYAKAVAIITAIQKEEAAAADSTEEAAS